MNAVVTTFAYHHAKELVAMVDSLTPGNHFMEVWIHLHSRKPDVVDACFDLARRHHVRLFPWFENRGLAKSFNDTLINAFEQEGVDVVVNANDDTLWSDGDLGRLLDYCQRNPRYYAVETVGDSANGGRRGQDYSACAFTRLAWDTLGCEDENYKYAYWEDVDYGRRSRLAGLAFGTCADTNVFHFGSKTLANDKALRNGLHNEQFPRNMDYYRRKWGGLQGKETHATPFGNPNFGLRIPVDMRENPYPGYNSDMV